MLDELFRCELGVHALGPDDPLDPSGTECQCGSIAMIGVAAAVKGDRKIFFRYLIDTNPPDGEQEIATTEGPRD